MTGGPGAAGPLRARYDRPGLPPLPDLGGAPPGIEAALVTGKAARFDRLAGLGALRGPEVPALGDVKHVEEFAARQARQRARPGRGAGGGAGPPSLGQPGWLPFSGETGRDGGMKGAAAAVPLARGDCAMTPRGRHFYAHPGPTNIPDSVLHAVGHPTVDFNGAEFLAVYDACVAGLKRVVGTEAGHIFMYTGSGHAAWEATLTNLLSPGDRVLMLESGVFSSMWTAMARDLGIEVQMVPGDWRRGPDHAALRDALAADAAHAIKAVCAVHNETSTGITVSLPRVRAALDETGHPALLLADTISGLGSIDFRFDAWGIDAAVCGSQKGLMLPVGFAFTAASARALAAHATAKLPRHYFDWTIMQGRRQKSFVGTIPTNLFYGLREALRLLEEEGLPNVFARHHRLAEAVRRCVRHWSGNNGPQVYCLSPEAASDSVTAVLMPEGHDAEAVRHRALAMNVGLGTGLGPLQGKVFRIGHLGDLNEPMVLGTLAATEIALGQQGVPHMPGGVSAAMAWLAEDAA